MLHKYLQGAACPSVRKWARTLTCYLGRYALAPGRAVHTSATAVVRLATDETHTPPAPVALKWMGSRSQFLREIQLRRQFSCGSHVVAIRGWHVPAHEFEEVQRLLDLSERDEDQPSAAAAVFVAARATTTTTTDSSAALMSPGLGAEDDDGGDDPEPPVHTPADISTPYLLVMESGGPSLFHVLASQRIAGIDAGKCAAVFRALATQTARLHADGVVHCDIKPR